jgi:hypothetical protein
MEYFAAPLTSFGSSRPNSPPLGSVEATWEVESEIYIGKFSVLTRRFTEFTIA